MLAKIVEQGYPFAGFIIVLGGLMLNPLDITASQIKDLSNAFFIIFSISCGFTSTSLSILFTLQDRRPVKILKTSNAFYEIIDFHWRAIAWTFIAILSAFGVVLFPKFQILTVRIEYLMLAGGTGAILAVHRVILLFVRVLQLDKAS